MSKDYYLKKRQPPPRKGFLKQTGLLLMTFVTGYFTAVLFDFNTLSTWVNEKVLAQHGAPKPTAVAQKPQPAKKPTFEFYTLLTKDNGAPLPQEKLQTQQIQAVVQPTMPAPASTVPTVTVAEAKAVASPATIPKLKKEAYLVQLAAFNKRQDAEQLKASLVLRGFDVNVSAVAQGNKTWFRVLVGPFPSRLDAQKAQLALGQTNKMQGMIRKMDA